MQRQQLESRNRVHELGIQECAVFQSAVACSCLAGGRRVFPDVLACHTLRI